MNDIQKATVAAIVNVFETGRPRGDYGAIAVLKGDTGHLSYGRSQVSLGAEGFSSYSRFTVKRQARSLLGI